MAIKTNNINDNAVKNPLKVPYDACRITFHYFKTQGADGENGTDGRDGHIGKHGIQGQHGEKGEAAQFYNVVNLIKVTFSLNTFQFILPIIKNSYYIIIISFTLLYSFICLGHLKNFKHLIFCHL